MIRTVPVIKGPGDGVSNSEDEPVTDSEMKPALKQTSQVQRVIHFAIEAFTAELLFVNAHPSDAERPKNSRQILVNVAKECSYAEMAQGIQNDLDYFKGLASIVHKRMNNVRQEFKKMVLGSIEVVYNINECKGLTYEALFGVRVYIFPLEDDTVSGVSDQNNAYLNPGLIRFTEIFIAKNSDYFEKYNDRFPICSGKTEMHPELLAFLATLIHAALLEKVQNISFSLTSRDIINVYRGHVKTLATMKKIDKTRYHQIMTTFRSAVYPDELNSDGNDRSFLLESDKIIKFMGISGGK